MLQMTEPLFTGVIDRLVSIREQIAILKEQETELEALLKDGGEARYAGSTVDALIFIQKRHYVDWKGLCQYLKIKRRTIKLFTSGQDVTCLKLVAKRISRKVA